MPTGGTMCKWLNRNLPVVLLLFAIFTIGCTPNSSEKGPPHVAVRLKLPQPGFREAQVATVELINDSPRTVRLWSRGGSWDHGLITLKVTVLTANGESHYQIKPNGSAYTYSLDWPDYSELKPRKSRTDYLKLQDGSWSIPAELLDHLDGPLILRAVFATPDSPEAKEHHVYVGSAVSEPIRSDPPHTWLCVGQIKPDGQR